MVFIDPRGVRRGIGLRWKLSCWRRYPLRFAGANFTAGGCELRISLGKPATRYGRPSTCGGQAYEVGSRKAKVENGIMRGNGRRSPGSKIRPAIFFQCSKRRCENFRLRLVCEP